MAAEYEIFERIKKNPSARIWRYMNFTKFVYLLDTGCLYFRRSDKLEDRFEGSTPKPNFYFQGERHSDFIKQFRRYVAINCWHINTRESAAMWQLYGKGKSGIAIQSTYERLMESFSEVEEKPEVGQIQYIDFQTDFSLIVNQSEFLTGRNHYYQFMYKRKSFKHENELRALICRPPPSTAEARLDLSEDLILDGIPVKVAIKTLIEKIFIHPDAPLWLIELVKSIAKKYDIHDAEIPVKQSSLAGDPIY